jgi:hypothetical protein
MPALDLRLLSLALKLASDIGRGMGLTKASMPLPRSGDLPIQAHHLSWLKS